jgi:erythromycin esterase-like protein
VTAASEWGGPAERKQVRPALDGSFERLFHELPIDDFLLPLARTGDALADVRLERAIGVIYRPQTERTSHWFTAQLPQQFDAVIHFDHTRAVEPLERTALWDEGEAPETYPTGF